MKKPIFVWIIIILLGFSVVSAAFGVVITGAMGGFSECITNLVTLIINAVLLVKLFKLQKDAMTWVHIAFTWVPVSMIYMTLFVYPSANNSSNLNWGVLTLAVVIYILIWVSIVKRLQKALSSTNSAKVF